MTCCSNLANPRLNPLLPLPFPDCVGGIAVSPWLLPCSSILWHSSGPRMFCNVFGSEEQHGHRMLLHGSNLPCWLTSTPQSSIDSRAYCQHSPLPPLPSSDPTGVAGVLCVHRHVLGRVATRSVAHVCPLSTPTAEQSVDPPPSLYGGHGCCRSVMRPSACVVSGRPAAGGGVHPAHTAH
jgi:hypothetical protein